MLKRMLTKVKYHIPRTQNEKSKDSSVVNISNQIQYIPESIIQVKEKLNEIFSESSDFIIKEVVLRNNPKTVILITYIEGMTDIGLLNENLLKPLQKNETRVYSEQGFKIINFLKESVLTCSKIEEIKDFKKTIKNILGGDILLYIDGIAVALSVSLPGAKSRSIAEPNTDVVVRGPREGFTELLDANKTMLRRKIRNTNLKFENITIGEQTDTKVSICYIKGIASEQIVETVLNRLMAIDTDAILESGYLEEFIEDEPFSIFPTVGHYEKPDIVAGKLLEGRVAILCDGTPFVLTVPYLFVETIQISEDYYSRYPIVSFSRVIRILALFISTNLPAIYLALIAFHQEVIPYKLLITIAASREGVPYSPFAEAILMLFTFEILSEAGLRMPKSVGSTVSIVGALVLGQSAVQAGLASTPMVIVTAITAISGFITTPLLGVTPLIRMVSLISANILGLLGVIIVNVAILIHISTIKSFGIPYLYPFSPISITDLKDTVVRVPLWAMLTRPRALTWRKTNKLKYRTKANLRKKEE